jgi:dihydrodipicolinate synthase/N-acetylneuraminate lyase
VLAAACIAPALAVAVWDAVQRGHPEDGAGAQAGLARIAAEIAGAFGVPGLKAAVEAAGASCGAPRAPLLRLGDEARATVATVARDVLGATE